MLQSSWRANALARFVVVGLVVVSFGAEVLAMCEDKGPRACVTADGRPGFRECQANGHMGPCIAESKPTPTVNGKVKPKFYVLAIVYMPPGTKGGDTESKVTYKAGSSTGSSVSASGTFKNGVEVTASVKNGPVTVGAGFTADNAKTDSEKMEVEKNKSTTLEAVAPSTDGIDRSRDLIYFLINPELSVTIHGGTLDWSFAGTATLRYVRVGWLEKPDTMPGGVKRELEQYGFTTNDYKEMLKVYPFANGKTAIDAERFAFTGFNLPYIPPDTDQPVPTASGTLDNKDTNVAGLGYESSADVSLSVGVDAEFTKQFEAKMESKATWTWTVSNETEATDAKSQTAEFVLGGPSKGYTGPIGVDVYYDTLYKTFMFAFPPEGTPVRASGTVEYQTQGPIRHREVSLRVRGRRYRTYTNQFGEYRFYGKPVRGMTVEVEGIGRRKIYSISRPVMDFIVTDKLTAAQLSK